MKKIKKITASIMAVAAMATSQFAINASANNVYEPGIGAFTWDNTEATIENLASNTRLVTTYCTVYRDDTGAYENDFGADNRKWNSTLQTYVVNGNTATVDYSGYSINTYHFRVSGSVYNTTLPIAGVAWSSGYKYAG